MQSPNRGRKILLSASFLLLAICTLPSAMVMAGPEDAAAAKEGRSGFWRKSSQGAPDLTKCKARVDKNPTDPIALNDYGFALRQNNKLDEAEKYLKQAIEIKPGLAQAHTNLSVVYYDQKRYEEAVKEATAAVKLDANHAIFRVVLGNALSKTGDLKGAAQEYRIAIKLKPDYENAHYNLGRVLLEDGQVSEARFALADAINLDPDDDRTLALLDKLEAGGASPAGSVEKQKSSGDLKVSGPKAVTK